ncbi:hypothetical protein X975_25920, partial [Stegodyphus mimosarum]
MLFSFAQTTYPTHKQNTLLHIHLQISSQNHARTAFFLSEVYEYITKLKIKSSRKLDLITNKMLKNRGVLMILKLTEISNDMLYFGPFPTLWKSAVISPVLKPNKSPSDPVSYQLIS